MAVSKEAGKMGDNEREEDVGDETSVDEQPTETEKEGIESNDEETKDVDVSSDILEAINGLKSDILSLRDIVSVFVDAGAVVSDDSICDGDNDEDDNPNGDYIPIDNMDLNL